MGSAQSYIPVATVILAAAAYGYVQVTNPPAVSQVPSTSASSSLKKQKQQRKRGETSVRSSAKEDASVEPNVVSFPPVVPGDFDSPALPVSELEPKAGRAKPRKKKAKKASTPVSNDAQSESSATAPESSVARKPKKAGTAKQPALDNDGWTRVETKKRVAQKAGSPVGESTEGRPLEISTSDAGITTSVTGNSSPVTERTEEESHLADSYVEDNRRTLAEKLLPKPRKTGVEDLLEESDYPQLSRVMRIKPRPDELPAAGFSWGDYEDVDNLRGTADDADGEDDGGWGVVKGRGRAKTNKISSQQIPTAQRAPETLTKKQRQRAARKEVEKAANADAEAERLATLAKHKRELERIRMAEQAKSSSKKTPSGGMAASVDENGKLVWQ